MRTPPSFFVVTSAALAACAGSPSGGATTVVVNPASAEVATASASPDAPQPATPDKPVVVTVGDTTIRYVVGSPEATAAVMKGVRRARSSAVACYEGAATRSRGLRGKIVVEVLLTATGEVRSVREAGSTLPDRDLVDCVLRAFRAAPFEDLDGHCSGEVEVTEPLVFDPAL